MSDNYPIPQPKRVLYINTALFIIGLLPSILFAPRVTFLYELNSTLATLTALVWITLPFVIVISIILAWITWAKLKYDAAVKLSLLPWAWMVLGLGILLY